FLNLLNKNLKNREKMKKIARVVIKKVFGIDSLQLFIKKQKKRINKLIYTKKYTATDLVTKMKELGLAKGSVVFIHSSMTEFYNYQGTAEELIQKIIDEIGEEGTLLMPAYPPRKNELIKKAQSTNEVVFDVLKTPSGAGYLTEVFRKWPGVKRSINLQHSVCAYGKLADYFTNEHHLSETAWDEKSPYYKLAEKNALIFALGLEYFLGTIIHCTESLLKDKYKYFSLFFKNEFSYKYKNENGIEGIHSQFIPDNKRKRSKVRIIKYFFDKKEFFYTKISNLRIEMVYARYTLDLFLQLAEKGITMYSEPNPELYKKNGKFIKIDEDK